jgi:parallel beta-helix repeat protein
LYFEKSLRSCSDPCTRDYPSNSPIHRRYNENPFLEVISFLLRVEEKMKKLVLSVVVVGFTCLFTSAALGDIIQVPTQYPTIQAGIDAASSGDTVEVAPGTYYENITMKSGVMIQGAGAGDDPSIHSIIDGGGTGSVVTASGVGSEATLDGFTITNGGGTIGGGMHNESSSPTVSNCTFSGNSADYYGGGMHNESSSPTVTNCAFSGNSADYYGGGMSNSSSSPTVTNCTFSGNSATYNSGGMSNWGSSSPTVTNCTFSGNSADFGGGMYNDSSSPTVSNCTFSGNSAGQQGSGMYNNTSSPTVTNCTFSGNSADYYGGGMSNSSSSSPTVTNCTFSGNSASAYAGGGMYNNTSSPTVTNCTFSGNSAGQQGGGMSNSSSSPTVTNCTFSGNSAAGGGGVYNYSSSPTVTNCTFFGNSAAGYGGGMFNWQSSFPTVTNCILWGDSSPEIYSEAGLSPSVSYSDIQGGYPGTGNINADPRFVDPDGPDDVVGTQDDDLHLTELSPCIDMGTSSGAPDTDLEGNMRPQGDGYDMGAYESPFTKPKAMPWIPLLLGD